ncbi:hypothetical protein TNCV_3892241 [Trichonephila clavipes]|nr:hypothetical protein TNCV_3892241 [Trichonephila clavipes]
MPSPVQSNCDAHDTIANGQYGAVWSMGHTQQVCVRIVLLPSNVWQQFFGRSAFLRQQETDLPPAELWLSQERDEASIVNEVLCPGGLDRKMPLNQPPIYIKQPLTINIADNNQHG